ncbi:9707_t:CDS:10, partial [Scutellospora calospora]
GFNINRIIGGGIFDSDSIWILVQSPGITLVLYVVCGFISLLGSLIYIELGIISLPKGKYSINWTDIFNKPSPNFGAYGNAIIKVLFAYEGWNDINYLIEELREPKDSNLKFSSLLSVCVSLLLYFSTNAAFITVVGRNIITEDKGSPIALRFGKELRGKTGEILMSALVAISAFGSVGSMVFTYARIITYAAETKFIPERFNIFNHYNKKFNTPTNALLVQFLYCIMVLMVLMGLSIISSDPFDFFSDTSQYLSMIFHGASAICLLSIMKRLTNVNFNISKYIVIIYFLIIILVVIISLFPPETEIVNWYYLIPYAISLAAILLGSIIWYFRNRGQSGGNDDTDDTTDQYS